MEREKMDVIKKRHYENSKRLVAKEIARQWRVYMTKKEHFLNVELRKDVTAFKIEVDWSCTFTRKSYYTIISFVLHERYPYARELAKETENFLKEALEEGTRMFLTLENDRNIKEVKVSDKEEGDEEVYYFNLTIIK